MAIIFHSFATKEQSTNKTYVKSGKERKNADNIGHRCWAMNLESLPL